MISIFGQFSGNGLGYFNTVIYSNLGVKSVPKQLAYNLLSSVISCFSALAGSALTDRMLRRRVLIIGTLVCSALLPRRPDPHIHLQDASSGRTATGRIRAQDVYCEWSP